MEFDNIETLKRAIEINAGVSLLSEPTVQREIAAGTLAAVPLDGVDLTRPVGIIQRRGAELGATARRFVQFLRSHSFLPKKENGKAQKYPSTPPTEPSAQGDVSVVNQ